MVLLSFITSFVLCFSGCLDFGDYVSSTNPSQKLINRCTQAMFLNAKIIEPVGIEADDRGIDSHIFYKFIAKTDKIEDVFQSPQVDTTLFKPGYSIVNESPASWWDAKQKSLIGGQVDLPNVKYMHVGYVNNSDGTLTVYIFWFEV